MATSLRRLARALIPHPTVPLTNVSRDVSKCARPVVTWIHTPWTTRTPKWTPPSLVRWMGTVSASDLRVGNVIEKDGQLLRLTKVSYTQGQARQSGNVQVELKNIRTGSKQSQRLSPSDKLEKAVLDEEPHSFLYQTGSELVLMHNKTYDQVEVNVELLGDAVKFLSDDCEVTLLTHEGVIVSAALSEEVEMEIAGPGGWDDEAGDEPEEEPEPAAAD